MSNLINQIPILVDSVGINWLKVEVKRGHVFFIVGGPDKARRLTVKMTPLNIGRLCFFVQSGDNLSNPLPTSILYSKDDKPYSGLLLVPTRHPRGLVDWEIVLGLVGPQDSNDTVSFVKGSVSTFRVMEHKSLHAWLDNVLRVVHILMTQEGWSADNPFPNTRNMKTRVTLNHDLSMR